MIRWQPKPGPRPPKPTSGSGVKPPKRKPEMIEVTRPALRWHGGKWILAPWIIGHFPAHRIYVEPYGGAASVLMRKPRCYSEVYNDLDSEVVTLFRVLQDAGNAAELKRRLEVTPFARAEFEIAWDETADPVEIARRLIMRAFMGFGSNAHNSKGAGHKSTGFRANSNRSNTTPAHDWANYPGALAAMVERFRGVIVEHRPALQVMASHDSPTTLHYVDPPYLPETRSHKNPYNPKHQYRHEMSIADHAAMLDGLKALKGYVVLSGYPSAFYDAALQGWLRVERHAMADGARPRVEVLWINPAAARAMEQRPLSLFDHERQAVAQIHPENE